MSTHVKLTYALQRKMTALQGSYTIPFLGVSIFIAALTYITYRLLSSYLHKWFEMRPIPEMEGTYPFIGNALMFKTNAGGKRTINTAQKDTHAKLMS